MNTFEKFLCFNMKVADFLVSKQSVWSTSPLEDYWSRELIVMHPFRILIRWIYLLPIAGFFALLGWAGVLGGFYYLGHGIFTLMPPEIIAGLFTILVSYVLACLCTVFLAKHLLATVDLVILLGRHKRITGTITEMKKQKSGTPATPVYTWQINVTYVFEDEQGRKQTVHHFGRTQVSIFHDWLEKDLHKGAVVNLQVDPKNLKRARIVYS